MSIPGTTAADDTPIPLSALKTEVPWWPFGPWWTGKLVRDGKLSCIRLGRRIFFTRAILDAYVKSNMIQM